MLIPLPELCKRFHVTLTGVLHVGAHECEEMQAYRTAGVADDKVHWVEAIPEKAAWVEEHYPNTNIYKAAIHSEDGAMLPFYVTNNGQSSSLLKFGTHKTSYPGIVVVDTICVRTTTLATLIEKEKIPVRDLNFLNLDIQGVELVALKSMGSYLDNFDYVYTEVNNKEVYEGCDQLSEMDDFLGKAGFQRADIRMFWNQGWGDAFYVRRTDN